MEPHERLLSYHLWATGRLLDLVAQVSPGEFTRPLGGSFGSLQGLCAHVLGAEWVWLERLAGRAPNTWPAVAGADTPAEARETWKELASRHRARLAGSAASSPGPRSAALGVPFSYVNLSGVRCTYTMGDVLLHLVNHGTYHRGQLSHMLRQLDRTPMPTDYLVYLDEQTDVA